jgi:tetratricopeptide (TPR) repeat protein
MRYRGRVFLNVLAILLAWTGVAFAMHVIFETKRVPVDRLIRNLEAQFAADSTDSHVAFRIGRLHSMTYALAMDSVDVITNGGPLDGMEDLDELPYVTHKDLVKRRDRHMRDEAEEHLQRAIEWYDRSLMLEPKQPIAHLGRGWCLQQVGRNRDAKDAYRRIIDESFEQWHARGERRNGARDYLPPPRHLTFEALTYLIDLLNPVLEARERMTRKKQLKQIEREWTWHWVTPIAIPLVGNIDLADIIDGAPAVAFDLDGSGRDQTWEWINPNAGWLVHDFQGTGRVRSGRDLFGSVTFWIFWRHGYEALSALDDDGDRYLRGSELDGLAIWHDTNSNGVSEPGEVRSLASWGVTALSCASAPVDVGGFEMRLSDAGVEFADGSTRPTYDLVLTRRAIFYELTNRP